MKNLKKIALLLFLGNVISYAQKNSVAAFIPKGYVLHDTIFGDLNKDNQEDCVLIIKGTDAESIVSNRFDEIVDRNRRGIIILFNNKNNYQKITENLDCFSSEHEDGGVYFAPELYFEIKRGNLIVRYGHGRYGYWSYTFRYQESKFKLIGYDETNGGVVIRNQTSINFLIKKKLVRENTNEDAEGGDEVFKDTWSKIKIDTLLDLSQIEDFDELDVDY